MEQLSTDWFQWRSEGIGSSDVAAILGLSPYMTPLELYRVKTGEAEQAVDNFATYRGRKYEAKARASFELSSSKDYEPKLFQSKEYPFMRVSLDGWHQQDREVLEIKCPSKETLELARLGQLPAHYYAQVQYQLFVANAKNAIYYAYDPDSEVGYSVPVKPDFPYLESAIPKVLQFWMKVRRREAPEPTEKDWVNFPAKMEPLLATWKDLHLNKDPYALEIKRQIVEKMTHPKMRGFGVKVHATYQRNNAIGFRINIDEGKRGRVEENEPEQI